MWFAASKRLCKRVHNEDPLEAMGSFHPWEPTACFSAMGGFKACLVRLLLLDSRVLAKG